MRSVRNVLGQILAGMGVRVLAGIVAVVVMAGGSIPAYATNWLTTAIGPSADVVLSSSNSPPAAAETGAPLPKPIESPSAPASGLTLLDGGQIVYDANQGVYWLANANLAADPVITAALGVPGINPNGTMSYTTALRWVEALNNYNSGSGYLGHDNWQLPDTPHTDTTCAVLTGPDGNSFGPNCTESALGNLYSAGLDLAFPTSVASALTNTIGLFENIQPALYWGSDSNGMGQKTFSFLTGLIGSNTTQYNYFYVLPMVTGTIGITTGGSGLVGYASGKAAGKAVYDTDTNVTWVLDADLALSRRFGLTGTTTITAPHGLVITAPVIAATGSMLFETANEWITASNQISYAGTNQWMLPTTANLLSLYVHLNLHPGDSRLTVYGGDGPFQNLQPFFYWACVRDQNGDSRLPCNGTVADPGTGGRPLEFSVNLESGFEGTDLENKEFYVAVYYVPRVYLPVVFSE